MNTTGMSLEIRQSFSGKEDREPTTPAIISCKVLPRTFSSPKKCGILVGLVRQKAMRS